jgi:glycosyltransferase involved in cell wall biosynthesis/SAM-dependent methyltransferase
MKILMVSPFPPLRDGVGKYASQEVAALRKEGHDVEILAPLACAADHVENFKSWAGGLAKLRGYARRYDRVLLQYQPAHFHWRRSGPARVASNFWMMVAFRTIKNLTIVCHEVEYPAPKWPKWRPEVFFDRLAWSGARHVEFHTDREIEQMRERLGVTPRETVLRDHGRYFTPSIAEDRAHARDRLGIPQDLPMLLCIGFIAPHKGFDRAIRAFRRVPGHALLIIVGSVSVETSEHRGYINELIDLTATDDRVELHERMVSDEEFDRWIVASDVVLLPYREIWSSGVLERARVFDRQVIATRAGGLAEQVHPGDVVVADDEELARAIADVVGAGPPSEPEAMSVAEALAFVEDETGRRREGARREGVDKALYLLDHSRGVHPVILPSERRVIGRGLDLIKHIARRGLGWLLTPLLGQINEFERLTVEALEAMTSEHRGTDPSQYNLVDYDRFEQKFRGDTELLKEKQRGYVKEFTGRGPVLDVGCGRGEFLELLNEAGIEATGIDLSLDMVTAARRKGLKVDHGDAIAYLRNIRPGSLGGIMASQVVEHLAPRALVEFLGVARRAVRGGGILIMETINPQSLFALSNWYVMDLTHAQPLHPHTLSFIAEEAGFVDIEVRYLSPARPPREPLDVDADAPEWARTLSKTVDEELGSLSDIVFGLQDYALIARVR